MRILKLTIMMVLFCTNVMASNIEIEADDSLEWYRDKKIYVAKGNAKAVQGDKSVLSDLIYAHYKKEKEEDVKIWKVEAKGNVLIESGKDKIVGDNAVYNVDKKVFVVTGDNLNVLSDNYQIKAKKKIEYYENENKVIANGDVIVYQNDNEMYCDNLEGLLSENVNGELEVSEIFAVGNVKIKTLTDQITGEKGYYNIKKEESEIEGNVTIARENSVITGNKAIVNMKTGIAKMLSSKGKKVKAIFVSE